MSKRKASLVPNTEHEFDLIYVDPSQVAPNPKLPKPEVKVINPSQVVEIQGNIHFKQDGDESQIVISEDGDSSSHAVGSVMKESVYVISEITQDNFVINQEGEETTEVVAEYNVESEDVQLIDFGGCCANCSVPFDEIESPKVSELFLSENNEGGSSGIAVENQQLEYGIVVNVSDALSFIFEAKLNDEELGGPLVDSGIGLCHKCGDILAQMYKLHRDFLGCATANSYLDLLFARVFQREENSKENEIVQSESGTTSTTIPQNKLSYENQTAKEHIRNSSSHINWSTTTDVEPPKPGIGIFTHSSRLVPTSENSGSDSQTTADSQASSSTSSQPNYLVICPVVIAANAGTNVLATIQQQPQQVDNFFKDPTQFPVGRRRRNRPKYTSTCPECGKTLRSYIKNALESHINIVHLNKSSHTCTICGRPCSNHKNLETHLRTHLGKHERQEIPAPKKEVQQFLCPICGTTVRSSSSLRLHMSKHTDPKPFQCNNCDRRFGDRVSLRKHQIIHEDDGIFPHKCQACGQAFKVPSLLKEHNMFCISKMAERPHKCSICLKRFKLKQHLELHLSEMHKYSKEDAREVVYPGLPKKKRAK